MSCSAEAPCVSHPGTVMPASATLRPALLSALPPPSPLPVPEAMMPYLLLSALPLLTRRSRRDGTNFAGNASRIGGGYQALA